MQIKLDDLKGIEHNAFKKSSKINLSVKFFTLPIIPYKTIIKENIDFKDKIKLVETMSKFKLTSN